MAVYVDNYNAPFRNMTMCHMMADTHKELITMASRIGVKLKWIQYPGRWNEHFDICLSKKKLAIQLGAIEVSSKDMIKKFSPYFKEKDNAKTI